MNPKRLNIAPLVAWLSCVVALSVIGCGGGSGGGGNDGGSPVDPSTTTRYETTVSQTSATMDDGGHYASLSLIASASGIANITVISSTFDPMVVIERIDDDGSSEVVAEDDDGGGGTSAKATFSVISGRRYSILATSASGDPAGALTIVYSSNVLSPDGRGRSVPSSTKRKS